MRLLFCFLISFVSLTVVGQSAIFNKKGATKNENSTETEITVNKFIDGTLLVPKDIEKPNLVILIAGSGPLDRDGNQNFLINDTQKKIAIGLFNNGIASFRYDKRIAKQIKEGNVDKSIKFNDFTTDAISVINYFKKEKKYNKIYVAGHSQGSLVGLLAASKTSIDGFISLAGAGQPIDAVIKEQINKTAPMFNADTEVVLKILKSGKTTQEYPQALTSIFNISIQPFMISWMKYNPVEEIKKLTIPVLIVNGTKDLQVSEQEANFLKEAYPNAQLSIIENMNHVLVTIEGNDLENSKSYNKPNLPLSDGLIEVLTTFIKDNNQ